MQTRTRRTSLSLLSFALALSLAPLAQATDAQAPNGPQALPGSKMASAGADWRTNPITQINWGIGYIKGRYGTPCSAWAHSNAVGWY